MGDKDLNLDPSGDWMVAPTEVFNILYDSLYLINEKGEIEPSLAASLPVISGDGKTYRIPIRKEVHFHDDPCFKTGKGRDVRAEDVIYSLKRIADPKNETGLWSLLSGRIEGFDEYRKILQEGKGSFDDPVKGLKALNHQELEIRLTRPLGQILYILSMPAFGIVPREAVEKYKDEFKHHPVGTGPFRLLRYGSKEILVERVSGHWRNPPATKEDLPQAILFKLFDDPWNAFKASGLDVLYIDPRRIHAYLDERFQVKPELQETGFGLLKVQDVTTTFLIFNHEDPLMQNIHLRRAIAYGVPWKDLLDPVDVLTASIVPSSIPGSLHLEYEWNPAKAREELAKAGYPAGKGLPEIVLRFHWPVRLFASGVVEDALDHLGIRTRLEFKDQADLEGAHLGWQAWSLDYPEASSVLTLLDSHALPPEGINYGFFKNQTYDSLLDQAAQLPSSDRAKVYGEMVRFIFDNVAVVPYRQYPNYYALSPRIRFLDADLLGYLRWSHLRLKPNPETKTEVSSP